MGGFYLTQAAKADLKFVADEAFAGAPLSRSP